MSDNHGTGGGIDERFPAMYDELRRLASAVSKNLPPHRTLNPTALVNEAYLKLAGSKEFSATSTLHFKRIAARVMRQILLDAARRHLANKRGGSDAIRVPLDEQFEKKILSVEYIVILDDLLETLKSLDPRQAALVEYRFYGGLTDEEIAAELGISKTTVDRDWRAARAWLVSQLDKPDL